VAHPNTFVGVSKLTSPKTMFLPTLKIIFLVVRTSGGRWRGQNKDLVGNIWVGAMVPLPSLVVGSVLPGRPVQFF
jgi:hypothetical protein